MRGCVRGSVATDVGLSGVSSRNFTLRRSQWFGVAVLVLLVVIFSAAMLTNIRNDHKRTILVVLLVPIFLVNGSLVYSRLRDFRRIQAQLDDERRRLEEKDAALRRADDEIRSRLDTERKDRTELEWLNSTVRSISSKFKSTIVPDAIAESLVESLGQALKVDVVLFYSFPNFPQPRMWKQWHNQTDVPTGESLATENELGLSKLIEHLWKQKRSITVNDSHLIDISNDPLPKLAAITQMRARSWVLVPLGAGSQVLGCLGVGMIENPRVWTPTEIELMQKVVSEVADVFIQARLFNQSMLIAENDSEVNRLIELDKVKTDLIENINHELRTPLASIIGYMEVVMDGVDSRVDPELVPSLAAVQRNAVRLQGLIENMMRVSNAEFNHMPLDVATVDIGLLLGDVVDSLQLGAADSGVALTLRLDSPEGDLFIDGDRSQLEQVFSNLMSNAIKFTPREGTVTVVARRFHAGSDCVEVKVIDTGIGIPREEFPNVFKRFFRASTATQAFVPGFGIGLSLVHSIVREHHGTISFDSTVGMGTTFAVTLPVQYVPDAP